MLKNKKTISANIRSLAIEQMYDSRDWLKTRMERDTTVAGKKQPNPSLSKILQHE